MSNTFCSDIISDLYKEAYGFRPGLSFIETWNEMSDAEKQAEWDSLCDECDRTWQNEEDSEAYALDAFMQRLDDIQSLSPNLDTDDAIRWILQAEDFSDHDYLYGASYCAYHFGLSHQNDFKVNFERVCAEQATIAA